MRILLNTLIFIVFGQLSLLAQDSHKISIELDGYQLDTIYLGYYLGDKQYVRDTTVRQKDKFVFEGTEALPVGVYIVIIPPTNDIIQILVDEDQQFTISAKYDKGPKDITFKSNDENTLYYSYIRYIQDLRPESDQLKKQLDSLDAEQQTDQYQQLTERMTAIDAGVENLADEIVQNHPESYTALLLKANKQIDVPEFTGDDSEVQLKRFHYFKKRYFEKFYLSDPRMFRTPYLFDRVNYYTDKLTMRAPDSIKLSIDEVLKPLEYNESAFQFYLVHFLNKYAKSKIVGHDGVYVHLAETYYAQGKAPWTTGEQLNKILKNALDLKPVLIGKTAPNIELHDQQGEYVKIHDIESDYIVLYFWNPTCGHCKKSTPELIEFYKEYQSKGVKVVTVCGKTGKELGECWKYIDEHEGMDIFYNLADEYYKSRFKTIYFVKTTPKLYVLDRNKEIISKGIGVEQLPELMDYLIEQEKQEDNN